MKKSSRGFSLIELLIVVAIILIIAAIAIPDLLKSRQAANQASAVGSLRTTNTSEVAYSTTYTTGFSVDLQSLDGAAGAAATNVSAGLIDSILGSGIKSNYNFIYTSNPAAPGAAACVAAPVALGAATAPAAGVTYATYELSANPLGCASGNYYFTDMSGVIRMNNTAAASPSDSPLAG